MNETKTINDNLSDINFLVNTFKNHYRLVLKSVFIFMCIGFLLFFVSEKQYRSTTKIFPNSFDSTSNILSQAQNFGFNLGSDIGNDGIYSSDIYESILKSRRLAKATIQNEFSIDKSKANKIPLYQILFDGNKNEISEDEMISIATEDFINNHLSVYKAPGKSIISISMVTNDPLLSKSILDSLLFNMNEIYRDHNLSNNLLKLDFLEERITMNNQELLILEEKYEKFLLENKNYTNSVALIIQEDRIQRELDIVKSLSISLKRQYEGIKLETIDKSTAVEILDYPEVSFDYYSPSLLLNILSGIIIGFFFSLIIIYFRILSDLKNDI